MKPRIAYFALILAGFLFVIGHAQESYYEINGVLYPMNKGRCLPAIGWRASPPSPRSLPKCKPGQPCPVPPATSAPSYPAAPYPIDPADIAPVLPLPPLPPPPVLPGEIEIEIDYARLADLVYARIVANAELFRGPRGEPGTPGGPGYIDSAAIIAVIRETLPPITVQTIDSDGNVIESEAVHLGGTLNLHHRISGGK